MENTLDTLAIEVKNLSKGFDNFLKAYEKGRDNHIEEHERINKELYGNGSDGIKTELKLNTEFRLNHKKAMFTLFGIVAANIIGLIFLLVK